MEKDCSHKWVPNVGNGCYVARNVSSIHAADPHLTCRRSLLSPPNADVSRDAELLLKAGCPPVAPRVLRVRSAHFCPQKRPQTTRNLQTAAEKGNQMRSKGSNEVVGRLDTRVAQNARGVVNVVVKGVTRASFGLRALLTPQLKTASGRRREEKGFMGVYMT